MSQVVTTQVTSTSSGGTVVNTGNRDWKADLLGCFDDCKTSKLLFGIFSLCRVIENNELQYIE